MNRQILRNIAVTASAALFIVVVVYAFDLWLWSILEARGPFYAPKISIQDALFVEGIATIILGFLLLLGRGGINALSAAAARIAAATKAIFGEAPSVSEIYKRDAWKPKGFPHLALIMIIAGIILILLYILL